MTRLRPMNDEEFRRSFEEGILRHADEMVRQGLWSREDATVAARSDMDQLLPQGKSTPGFVFLSIVDEVSGDRVGETWYSTESRGGRSHFWVHWISVYPPFRRRGHARSTFGLLETLARESGADRIGLHVLADNDEALAVYRKLGFSPTSHRMAKRLKR